MEKSISDACYFFSLVYFFIIHDNFVNLQAEILNIKK